jgi:hypothetical protein
VTLKKVSVWVCAMLLNDTVSRVARRTVVRFMLVLGGSVAVDVVGAVFGGVDGSIEKHWSGF